LSLDQLARAARAGLYLAIDSDIDVDFTEWSDLLPEVRGIYLAGDGSRLANVHLLSECVNLRSLVGMGLKAAVDVSGLERLEQAYVRGATAESAAMNASVRFLSIDDASPNQIVGPVERLSLEAKTIDLSSIIRPDRLTHLGIVSRTPVDLAPVARAAALESLFVRCREIRGIDNARRLGRICQLILAGVRVAPGFRDIASLDLERFEADPNFLFDDAFQRAIETKPGTWYLGRLRT
jgi:hypothetical protein